eukprot:scaffold1392_cov39-Tisochrysis_lutea.AAC.2
MFTPARHAMAARYFSHANFVSEVRNVAMCSMTMTRCAYGSGPVSASSSGGGGGFASASASTRAAAVRAKASRRSLSGSFDTPDGSVPRICSTST